MNGKNIAKFVIEFVTTAGVGCVVGNIITATTPADLSTAKKIGIKIGSLVIGAMVSSKVEEYVDEKIEEAEEFINALTTGKETVLISLEGDEDADSE